MFPGPSEHQHLVSLPLLPQALDHSPGQPQPLPDPTFKQRPRASHVGSENIPDRQDMRLEQYKVRCICKHSTWLGSRTPWSMCKRGAWKQRLFRVASLLPFLF